MKKNKYRSGISAQTLGPRVLRRHTVHLTIILVALIVLGMVLGYQVMRHAKTSESAPEVMGPDKQNWSGKKQALSDKQTTAEPPTAKKTPSRHPEVSSGKTAIQPDVSPGPDEDNGNALAQPGPETVVSHVSAEHARELVKELLHIPLEEINQTVQALVQQGEMAVPAIRELLESLEMGDFAESADRDPEDYRYLQLALIYALNQIGGNNALGILTRRLETTTDPEEIALLAIGIEKEAGGMYGEDILNAAQKVVELAVEDPTQVGNNLHALAKVFAEWGDESVVADLEALYPKQKMFSMMALAELPEGAGIPSLTRIVENPETAPVDRNWAWQMLAQASRVSPEASRILVNMAWSDQIPRDDFIKIASTLGGKEYRIIETQLFERLTRKELLNYKLPVTHFDSTSPSRWSDAEIDERLALIDQLLKTRPEYSVVRELEQARDSLKEWRTAEFVDGLRRK